MSDDTIEALADVPTDSRVRLHYVSVATGGEKTKTGIKTTDGLDFEVAVIDTETEFPGGEPRILRVKGTGRIVVDGPKSTQSIGMLSGLDVIDAPDDTDSHNVKAEHEA